jgi:hypothetical protein
MAEGKCLSRSINETIQVSLHNSEAPLLKFQMPTMTWIQPEYRVHIIDRQLTDLHFHDIGPSTDHW